MNASPLTSRTALLALGLLALAACSPPTREFPDGEGGAPTTGPTTGVGGQTTTSSSSSGDTTSSNSTGGGGNTSSSSTGGGGDTTSSSTGGDTTSSSTGMVDCLQDSDCGASSECKQVHCSGGMCVTTNVGFGTPIAAQSAGDCKSAVCDGQGGTTTIPDNNDAPPQTPNDCTVQACDGQGNPIAQPDANDPPVDDGIPCTGESCSGTTPIHPPLSAGTACNGGGAFVCNGAGQCINHCANGKIDYDEDGVDCGGSDCLSCGEPCDGDFCSGSTICCLCNGSFSCLLPKACNLCPQQ